MKRIFTPAILALVLILFQFTTLRAQNSNISGGFVFEGEPCLAINPQNPRHLVVAWMGYNLSPKLSIKTMVTLDGGQSWSQPVTLPHERPAFGSADPAMEFDGNGNLYLSYIDFDKVIDSGAVYLRKSTDGGLNWGPPVEAINMHSDPAKRPIDRPWIGVDRSGGAHDGTVYITTMNPGSFPVSPPYHPYLAYSNDGGNSFAPWRYLDTTGWRAGSLIVAPMPTPTVTANGKFHAIYPAYDPGSNPLPRYLMASSADGGNSLSHSTVFASLTGNSGDSLAKKGYLLRSNPADPDHLAFFYLSFDNGDADIVIRESFNGGQNWSGASRINDDPIGNGVLQDLVWADFDSDGDLVVTWRDRRNGGGSGYKVGSEIYASFRDQDSSSFSPNFPLSDTLAPYDSILNEAGNDFMGVRLANDTLNAVWGDVRTGRLNIWFTRMGLDGTVVSREQIVSEALPALRIFPNPSEGILQLEAPEMEEVELLSLSGKSIRRISGLGRVSQKVLDFSNLPAGLYLLKVSSRKISWVEKVVLK